MPPNTPFKPRSPAALSSGIAFATILGLVSAWAVPAEARRLQAPTQTAATPFAPADSLEGNYLAAYIAGASRDTAAAAVFYVTADAIAASDTPSTSFTISPSNGA